VTRRAGSSNSAEPMPVLFVGHGTPMNAIEDNEFARGWEEIGRQLPRPRAILCVSAHWETSGTRVLAMAKPRTIHDFGGFPRELSGVQYPAPGDISLAQEVKGLVTRAQVGLDQGWGLDHGCWVVLRRVFPAADVPVLQLSLDHTQPAARLYEIAQELDALRESGVLIIGSGNLVHNLALAEPRGGDFNQPFGFDWAIEADALFRKLVAERRDRELVNYPALGRAVQLAIPTNEHYLPMLFVIALRRKDDELTWFNAKPVAGSLTMTSFVLQNPDPRSSK